METNEEKAGYQNEDKTKRRELKLSKRGNMSDSPYRNSEYTLDEVKGDLVILGNPNITREKDHLVVRW